MPNTLTEDQQEKAGKVTGPLVWAVSMTLMIVSMALRSSGKLTIDQFTMLNCVVIVITAIGVWWLNRVRPGNISVSQESRDVSAWRRRACVVIGFVAVCIGSYKAILHLTAEKRVTKVCLALVPGMSVSGVTSIAESRGMYTPRDGASIYYIGEKATANQFGCLLKFNGRILASSTYHAD